MDKKEVKGREVDFGGGRRVFNSAMSPTTAGVRVNYTDVAKWSSTNTDNLNTALRDTQKALKFCIKSY